ncbi:site-specific integrase [Burkholderia cepacia]|uniref:Site-specific integrase n=1 Tax=Burkholderia cepacia TaxID=292 RepID=A0A8I1DP00_BURCE|nr:site-specific integrase [Burkholderia cepacia]MBA9897899.1 site-specific integrase [Burkholderia cepacia]MBA9949504.1 site-specific integrase [Burkholderia cepacia]MBA9976440.1 site-specific integrase [Burkholderia cepacia]MBA9997184.1 site-specific integrase [Burkholderia cepacia]MBB0002224.1 site-specific integrase [Burkholderia cepacia]
MIKIPRLQRDRNGTYYLRVVVPKSLQATLKQVEFRKSLGTKDFQQAKLLALHFNMQIETSRMTKPKITDFVLSPSDLNKYRINIKDGIIEATDAEDHARAMEAIEKIGMFKEAVTVAAGKLETKSQLLSDVVEKYLLEKKFDNKDSTLYEKNNCYSDFIEFSKKPKIGAVTTETAIAYKQYMLTNNTSAKRINAKVSFLKDLFEFAINNKYYFQANPFEKIRIAAKSRLAQNEIHWVAYIDDELKKIFSPKNYGFMRRKPDYFFGPLISLFTGMRIEEICAMRVELIKEEDGIHYFDIPADIAKSQKSIRKVPISDLIIKTGFLDYVADVKKHGKTHVFFYLPPDGKNGFSKNLSRRYGQYLDTSEINIVSPEKVFHSFRSTFINYLTDINTNPALVMSIVGHIEQNLVNVKLNSVHFTTYQVEKSLMTLKNVVDLVKFDFLDFSQFKYHRSMFNVWK